MTLNIFGVLDLDPFHLKHVDANKIDRERYLLFEWPEDYNPCLQELIQWYLQGKIVSRETVTEGFENAGVAFCNMMNGQNVGKMVVRI